MWLLNNQSLYTTTSESQAGRRSKHKTVRRNVNYGKTEFVSKYGPPIVSLKGKPGQPSTCTISNMCNTKENKVIAGDSFPWRILTIVTTQSEVKGSYEVEGSCAMLTFCVSLSGSYGFYRSAITWANGSRGLCQDFVPSLVTWGQKLCHRGKEMEGLKLGLEHGNWTEMNERRATMNKRADQVKGFPCAHLTISWRDTVTFPCSFLGWQNETSFLPAHILFTNLSDFWLTLVSAASVREKGQFPLLYFIQTRSLWMVEISKI